MEDQEAVLKRNLTRILKDLEQGTVTKAVPESNDTRKSDNVCPSSHVEGSGDNGKKKEDIVLMPVIADKKSSLEPNDEKPTKKEVDIVSTTTVSIEKTFKDIRSSVVATEKDISALEQVVTVEKCIAKNPGPSNIMDGSKVFIQIDGTTNEDGKSSENNMNSVCMF